MKTLEELSAEIDRIQLRNKSVETDKAWETSITRRIVLAILTYVSIGAYMQAINIEKPWLNAIIPSVAFMLSTLTLPFFKKMWIRIR
ncbi:MAG: hypothetical protein UV80_C0006G0061 [Candidatus Peregrinibacteria bacterium GW2011_GWF2_43_17]|nr:MAG: hypothetical protein UV80_C0006G0061 [Candidatus Peregrinibacteria bacterium GW2011_GWF2_43_17]KKT19587.1 MAG: hypothetical protein UW03_C0016G0044 [Candidatus Peregrinibacteria bacterium GW2011_GWA2_43_8]HAU39970.1 hypothetical protein [Candidatus Peregrinibacteria bacterium]